MVKSRVWRTFIIALQGAITALSRGHRIEPKGSTSGGHVWTMAVAEIIFSYMIFAVATTGGNLKMMGSNLPSTLSHVFNVGKVCPKVS